MKTISILGVSPVPAVGQGTWGMGEDTGRRKDEVRALRHGIGLGLSLIDTAEMYGDGGAEEVTGEAIKGRRDDVVIVSKVYPHNGGRREAVAACERSLRRLGSETIDLYLLHWPGTVPVDETLEAFTRLHQEGKIGAYGVSNFDTDELSEWCGTAGGGATAANQILYNLGRRGPEWSLLPWCADRSLTVMAYTPLEQVRGNPHPALVDMAGRLGVTPAQVALAWLLRRDGLIAIPKAVRIEHVEENAAAGELVLDAPDLAQLDAAFPPPDGPRRLEML